MAQNDRLTGPGQSFWTDGWDGYPVARARLLTDVAQTRAANPLVISGDVHCTWVTGLKVDFDDAKSPLIATEFCGTSITSQGPTPKQIAATLAENPHIRYGNGARGYLTVELTRDKCTTAVRGLASEKRADSAISTVAAFTVENGWAGAQSRMKLYGCPNSRSLRAVWALEEAAAEYQYVLVDLFKGAARTPGVLALNLAGKVPVLVDGELILTESGAIINYVSDKFPASALVPRDMPVRADCLRWMFFATTELEQPLWTIAKHRFALPKDKRVASVEATARWEFAGVAKLLGDAVGAREFICGDAFTGADILLVHTLAWARSAKIALDSARTHRLHGAAAGPPGSRARRDREAGATSAAGKSATLL